MVPRDMPANNQDLRAELQRIATRETAEYITANMKLVQSVESTEEVHNLAIEAAKVADGLVLEFGVYAV